MTNFSSNINNNLEYLEDNSTNTIENKSKQKIYFSF